MAYLMDRMSRAARQNNALLIVIYIPKMKKGRTNPPPPELTDSLNPETMFINLTDAVDRHFANPHNPPLTFAKDSHPSPLGHQLIALEIRQALQARGVF